MKIKKRTKAGLDVQMNQTFAMNTAQDKDIEYVFIV